MPIFIMPHELRLPGEPVCAAQRFAFVRFFAESFARKTDTRIQNIHVNVTNALRLHNCHVNLAQRISVFILNRVARAATDCRPR